MSLPDHPSQQGATHLQTSDVTHLPVRATTAEKVCALFHLTNSAKVCHANHDSYSDNLTLPATTYSKTNNHAESSDAGDDGILLPFALDPNPAPGPSPLNRSSRHFGDRPMAVTHTTGGDRRSGRDYFNRPTADHREKLKENSTRPVSTERRSQSPHIAYQEKGRHQSENLVDMLRKRKDATNESSSSTERSRSQHASPTPAQGAGPFKLQDVPKNKKGDARRRDSESDMPPQTQQQPQHDSPNIDMSARLSRPLIEPMTFTSSPPIGIQDSPDTSSSSFSSTQPVERPTRGDSLNPAAIRVSTRGDRSVLLPTTPSIERTSSAAAATANLNAGLGITSPAEPLSSKAFSDVPLPPARAAGRPAPPLTDTYTSPRAPPQPPTAQPSKGADAANSVHSEGSRDVFPPGGLPRYSAQGDFSMDEDFARLLGGQENKDDKESGVFRRVSNAVSKHGRSFSDRGSVNSRGHKKWPTNGSVDISSPTVASPDSKEESANLRNELRRAQQKIAELEAAKNGLEETLHSAADIRQANTVLREKRNTMAVLDTQREMVIRELEIMTDHLKHTKEGNGSMDINQLKSDVIKDFATSLEKLKDQLGNQIEELITKRAELTDEIANLIQMKDKGFQEYETLTAQNAKMSAMYRDLVDSIQKTYQTNKKGAPPNFDNSANGLGIYNVHSKGGKSELSVDAQGITHDHSFPHLHEADSEATLAQPQVVNIRKPGKANKFSTWKKGGQAIKTNVTKGFKGAFGSESTKQDEYNSIKVIGTPYGSVHTQPDLVAMSSSIKSKEDQQTPRGWFGAGKQPGSGKQYQPQDRFKSMQNNSTTNLAADATTVLFGSDLTARCEFEKQMIPRIVSRCIEEVELRGKETWPIKPNSNPNTVLGMDVEGVYRKSGGTSQVNQVRSGFEADNEHDISDPDLDIHAVTSALKNYFRRLPVPLITFDVYDQFLEAGRKLFIFNEADSRMLTCYTEVEDNEAQVKALIAAVNEIPKAHRDTLQFLVFHLSRVIQRASDNLVSHLTLYTYQGS